MKYKEALAFLKAGKFKGEDPPIDEYQRPTEPYREPYINGLIDLAIEALEKQIELSEYLKGMEKINDYDTRLVIEVKDLLREFMID